MLKSIILTVVCLLLTISSNTYSLPIFNLNLAAITKAPSQLAGNGIATAQYKVTNNTPSTQILMLARVQGIEQIVTGVGACANPFILNPGESCLLGLQIVGSQLGLGIYGGPVVCKTQAKSYAPNVCSVPKLTDNLNVTLIPCKSGTCLNPALSEQLRAIARKYKNSYGVPGLLAGVWIPEQGQLIIEDGVANIKTNRFISAADHVRIGSITKSFTVTLILQLIEQERLNLSTPVSAFFAVHNGAATMAELASMRSGIFNYTEDIPFITKLLADLLSSWSPQELIDVADANLPYFPPGHNWHYSNTNTVILGMIVEQLSGSILGNEIFQKILGPLNLTQTSYSYTPEMPEPFSRGYLSSPPSYEDITFSNPTSSAGSGAMVSTLGDLKIWAEALGRGTMLTPSMQAQRIASLAPIVFSPCADNDPSRPKFNCPVYDQYGYGLGQLSGWIGHTGGALGYQSLAMYNPKTGAVVVIITNLMPGGDNHIPTSIFKEYAAILK